MALEDDFIMVELVSINCIEAGPIIAYYMLGSGCVRCYYIV